MKVFEDDFNFISNIFRREAKDTCTKRLFKIKGRFFLNNTFNNCMRPKRFSGFTFIRNAQSQTFEIRGCISTETVEELYGKNT